MIIIIITDNNWKAKSAGKMLGAEYYSKSIQSTVENYRSGGEKRATLKQKSCQQGISESWILLEVQLNSNYKSSDEQVRGVFWSQRSTRYNN